MLKFLHQQFTFETSNPWFFVVEASMTPHLFTRDEDRRISTKGRPAALAHFSPGFPCPLHKNSGWLEIDYLEILVKLEID
jgi:hypothetical protein